MILGIDATNSFSLGVRGYVVNLLNASEPKNFGFNKVIIWGPSDTTDKLEPKDWLEIREHPYLDKNVFFRKYFQFFLLEKEVKRSQCDILFSAGGIYKGDFRPFVIVNHNMLPYESKERNRASKYSSFYYKMLLLLYNQLATFRNATFIIFTSEYARSYISKNYKGIAEIDNTVIPNGVRSNFSNPVNPQKKISEYTEANPFKLLYSSSVHIFKHHDVLVRAMAQIIKKGYPVHLNMIGPIFDKKSGDRMKAAIRKFDPAGKSILFSGYVDGFDKLTTLYKDADGYVFSSSCENMPTVLIEYMHAGRPIASSSFGPMPEILRDAGFYYDPTSVDSTAKAIEEMILDSEKRYEYAVKSKRYGGEYTWERTSIETMTALSNVASKEL